MSGHAGIDVGSTTAKLVVTDGAGAPLFSRYRRHNADVTGTLGSMLEEARGELGDIEVSVAVTGTAGMGVAERGRLVFVQELVACADYVHARYPDVGTLIDLGGEDAKIVFLGRRPDMRMNGNCAGGTGAFIDQMAMLLDTDPAGLDALAAEATHTYPIASRCGVFAKTDVQNLISRHVSRADVARSVFRAVALQTVSSLARGQDFRMRVAFSGGPLSFLPSLRSAFVEVLSLGPDDLRELEMPQYLPALGAALCTEGRGETLSLGDIGRRISSREGADRRLGTLPPLFTGELEREEWLERVNSARVGRVDPEEIDGAICFLGIDSGSTTTKLVLVDARGRIALQHYGANAGDPIGAVRQGLEGFAKSLADRGAHIQIGRVAVTGYGEDLDAGRLRCRRWSRGDDGPLPGRGAFRPDVSFVLDIGGQDMKAIFVSEGVLPTCRSTRPAHRVRLLHRDLCPLHGSRRRGLRPARLRAQRSPADLGTRCTVFMNSRIKQSLREGASPGDISAGLADSVVKNCFTKVLKIHDPAAVGEHVVVQGGTFRNPAVLKALEDYLGREVTRPDVPELMGAYGAALVAQEAWYREGRPPSRFGSVERAASEGGRFTRREVECAGCENACRVSRLELGDGRRFFIGNKCEKHFHNSGGAARTGENLVALKEELLFSRRTRPADPPRLRIGIPRALNMYDRFPFWCALLVESGFEVVLSRPSSQRLADRAARTVVSENLCFPAKLASAHVLDLVGSGVDRILYPMVKYEESEHEGAQNTFTCPVVLGYPDVVRSTIDPAGRHQVPFDTPVVSFADRELLQSSCLRYLASLGVHPDRARRAFHVALREQAAFRSALRQAGSRLARRRRAPGEPLILLVGRPYHADPLVNQKIPEMIASLGLDVLPEDAVPYYDKPGLSGLEILTQWSYVNRMLEAVRWAASEPNVEVVELNSFGCGPDALTYDEAREILAEKGKILTVVRVDEISSPGSNRLRLRSMAESLRLRGPDRPATFPERIRNRIFRRRDRGKTIIAPQFSPFFTLLLQSSFRELGYTLEVLPEPDRRSVETGLRYANNDICYPAIIVIGDIIKALQSGRFDPANTAVAISQTGGQCRASSYVSLLKKALLASGFPQVPVVSVSLGGIELNEQPGFRLDATRLLLRGLFATIYTDALSSIYTFAAVREQRKGDSLAALNACLAEAGRNALGRPWVMFRLLKRAIRRFRRIPLREGVFPRVGIVGEIYLKYNPFGNGNIVEWLISRGVEPVVPPILSFFIKRFVNVRFNQAHFVERFDALRAMAYRSVEHLVDRLTARANRILSSFHSLRPFHPIRRTARRARRVLSLVNQFGECWLLPGEICLLAEEDVNHVVSLQPFGCIANHVLAKGVERRLKDLYPELSVLYLDMDSGSSEVNTLNRLHFLVEGARRGSAGA